MNKKMQVATRTAYGQTLRQLGEKNKNIVVLSADLSKSTQTIDFARDFPDRFFNMGIAEQNMLGVAAGLAASGKIAFCSSFAVFAVGRSFEIIRNSIAYPALNVKIAATHAGITVGEDGGSHQSIVDISLMRSLPNMTVFSPADIVETVCCVKAAAQMNGPVYIRLGRSKVPVLHEGDFDFQTGKAVKMREGKDAVIISTGIMTSIALEAAELLCKEDIDVKVLNIHTIKPLDNEAIINAAKETGTVVTAEEHSIIGGLGSAVAEVLADHFPVPLVRVGIEDMFGQSGDPASLMIQYGLTAGDLAAAVKKAINKKRAFLS